MYVTVEFQEASDTIKEQRQKIEDLWEENRMLHDVIWNLNQRFMKDR